MTLDNLLRVAALVLFIIGALLAWNVFGNATLGDLFGLMMEGYNFDGIQSPGVARLGDAPYDTESTLFSVPNFYGAHGYDPRLASMSAILYAAGPHLRQGKKLGAVRNIDIAPTIMAILGVKPAPTVDGKAITQMFNKRVRTSDER